MSDDVVIVVAGLATVDILTCPVDLDRPLGSGVLNFADEVQISPGGIVSNCATDLARMDVRAGAIAAVGDDFWADYLNEQLGRSGVATAGLVRHDSLPTPATNVLVSPAGERSFIFSRGCGGELSNEVILDRLSLFRHARWLLYGYYSLFPDQDQRLPGLFEQIRSRGISVAMDCAGNGGGAEPLREILPHLDVYIPSLDEAVHQTGCEDPRDILSTYRQWGGRGIVGLKLGSRGALISPRPNEFLEVPPSPPPGPVVDTTGAGDAFYAGFLAGVVHGLDVAECGRVAAAAGAACVTAIGASAGIPAWSQLRLRL